MRDKLTEEELEIVEALRDCEESAISRVLPRREKMKLEQIGALMGLTRERVRQIEATALRKIRLRIVRDAKLRALFKNIYEGNYELRVTNYELVAL